MGGLLCSDGLTNMLSDARILAIVTEHGEDLEQACTAADRGGQSARRPRQHQRGAGAVSAVRVPQRVTAREANRRMIQKIGKYEVRARIGRGGWAWSSRLTTASAETPAPEEVGHDHVRRRLQGIPAVRASAAQGAGFPAVLFIQSDQIAQRPNASALSWPELRELVKDNVEVQSHSKTQGDLRRASGESESAYARRMQAELGSPLTPFLRAGRATAIPTGSGRSCGRQAVGREGFTVAARPMPRSSPCSSSTGVRSIPSGRWSNSKRT